MVLVNPFFMQDRTALYQFKWAVEREFKNPECQPYLVKRIEELSEPPFDSDGRSSCWHIYTHRKLYGRDRSPPFTLEQYERTFFWEIWEPLLIWSGFGFVLAAILSAVAYGMGKIVAWVVGGFRQPPGAP